MHDQDLRDAVLMDADLTGQELELYVFAVTPVLVVVLVRGSAISGFEHVQRPFRVTCKQLDLRRDKVVKCSEPDVSLVFHCSLLAFCRLVGHKVDTLLMLDEPWVEKELPCGINAPYLHGRVLIGAGTD